MKSMYVKNKKFIVSILVLMIGQAFLYWFLKIFQTNPHYIVLALDQKIPFIKNFVYIYDSFYPFYFIVFYLIYCNSPNSYYKGLLATFLGVIICDIIFLIYPTIMLRPEISEINNLTDFIVKVTYFFDEPAVNCFPSIHCLFCYQIIFGIMGTTYNSKKKILIIIYSILIVLSTMLIKQHYFYDALAALLVSSITTYIVYKFDLANKLKIDKLF